MVNKITTLGKSLRKRPTDAEQLLWKYLVSVYKLTVSKKGVIPAKAGIQSFQSSLDARLRTPAYNIQGQASGMTKIKMAIYK